MERHAEQRSIQMEILVKAGDYHVQSPSETWKDLMQSCEGH